jgi:hypothetical protein
MKIADWLWKQCKKFVDHYHDYPQRSIDLDKFTYKSAVPKYYNSKEMAAFMLALYDSEKTVGIVDGQTYEFNLPDPIITYAVRSIQNN